MSRLLAVRSKATFSPAFIRLATIVIVVLVCTWAQAQNAGDLPGENAVRATASAFTEAFDRGDAKALAALWTQNGMIADEQGAVVQGRQAIEGEYAKLFQARPNAKMKISILSIELPSPGVAIEDGVASVTVGEEPATASRYRAVHVLEDGKWLMTSVRESPAEANWNSPQLGQLEWLIGKWELRSGDVTAQFEVRWVANKAYIQREFTVKNGERTISSGFQTIGWDPSVGKIRSWSFDSTGGHGTGVWTKSADGWQIESSGVLADGTRTASRDFLIRVPGEESVFGWRSTDRKAGQSQLPDTLEVVFERATK